jgi:hypothetical protein
LSQTVAGFQLELAAESQLSNDAIRDFVANVLYEGLERGGYRDLDETIDGLRRGAPSG